MSYFQFYNTEKIEKSLQMKSCNQKITDISAEELTKMVN